jgi:hypothetical protein
VWVFVFASRCRIKEGKEKRKEEEVGEVGSTKRRKQERMPGWVVMYVSVCMCMCV